MCIQKVFLILVAVMLLIITSGCAQRQTELQVAQTQEELDQAEGKPAEIHGRPG